MDARKPAYHSKEDRYRWFCFGSLFADIGLIQSLCSRLYPELPGDQWSYLLQSLDLKIQGHSTSPRVRYDTVTTLAECAQAVELLAFWRQLNE